MKQLEQARLLLAKAMEDEHAVSRNIPLSTGVPLWPWSGGFGNTSRRSSQRARTRRRGHDPAWHRDSAGADRGILPRQ